MSQNKHKQNDNRRAFTLVELIVVVSIFALLSSVVLVSAASSRIKAADAQTQIAFDQMRQALEVYYNHYGGYPNPGYTPGGTATSDLYCVGSVTAQCMLLGKIISRPLTLAPSDAQFAKGPDSQSLFSYLIPVAHAANFPSVTTDSIKTTALVNGVPVTGKTKGFIYIPCNTNTPTCFEGTAEILAPTYQSGIVSQTLGVWEKLNFVQTTTSGSGAVNGGFTTPGNAPGTPGYSSPGSDPGSLFPPDTSGGSSGY